ncbi:MAG: efflux RND transporter periplasmic adaptor subunit [Verrucomicrobiales bacterium]
MKPHLFLLLLLVALLPACSDRNAQSSKKPQPFQVEFSTPLVKEIIEYADHTGRLEALEMVELRPRVSGYIQSVHFTEGQKVNKGDLLFVIDPRPFETEVSRHMALVRQNEAAFALAESNLVRGEKLVLNHSISREESEIRQSKALQAHAELQAAKANLKHAELDLEFTRVTAPITGIAGRYHATVGNLVVGEALTATLLTTIVPRSPIYAYFEVDERSLLHRTRHFFNGGQPNLLTEKNIPAYLGLEDETGFPRQGLINYRSNQLDPDTATITIRARFENEDEFLTPGLFARIRVPVSDKSERILIPDSAIGTDQAVKYVWTLNSDDKPERRTLTLGPKHENYRVVYAGLAKTDRIIVRGIQFVRPGVPLALEETTI